MTGESPAVRIIVADDDADIRSLVAIAVRKAGLDLLGQFADGESAWHAIREFEPDAVLLDVSMPVVTGLEVCQLIRADDRLRGIRVMILSAAVDDASQLLGIESGADDYLLKPFSPRDLVEHLSGIATQIGARL